MATKAKESKTVTIQFFNDDTSEVIYLMNGKQVGDKVHFDEIPKRLKFFLEKWPRS